MKIGTLGRAGVLLRIHLRKLLFLMVAGLIASQVFSGKTLQSWTAASATVQGEVKLKDRAFIAEGSKLFGPTCGNAYCHGTAGSGGGAPGLRGKGLEPAYLFKSISNGIPGTAMPSFKSELTEEQVWKLIAFIISDPDASAVHPENPDADKPPLQIAVPSKPSEQGGAPSLVGSAAAGKAVFFDSARPKSCHYCHSTQGQGTPIGPDLSNIGARSAKELFSSIILPRQTRDSRYGTVTLKLRNGETIVGVKKEEDAESIRVYDTAELPAVLRTIQKSELIKVEAAAESVMPKDFASTYTVKQLLDLVTFLKSSESKSPVLLKDLLE